MAIEIDDGKAGRWRLWMLDSQWRALAEAAGKAVEACGGGGWQAQVAARAAGNVRWLASRRWLRARGTGRVSAEVMEREIVRAIPVLLAEFAPRHAALGAAINAAADAFGAKSSADAAAESAVRAKLAAECRDYGGTPPPGRNRPAAEAAAARAAEAAARARIAADEADAAAEEARAAAFPSNAAAA